MDTHQEQHGANHQQTDPQLDALLDKAVSAGIPPADPELAKRIIDHTLPLLGHRPVIARIGPTLLRIAAAVVIVVGAGVAAMMLTNNQSIQIDPSDDLVQIGSDLQDIERAVDPGNTRIDEQLDVLSLRVELANAEGAWRDIDMDTNSLMDQTVTEYEIDQFSDDMMFIWADGSVLF
jgi:hypothetical protein